MPGALCSFDAWMIARIRKITSIDNAHRMLWMTLLTEISHGDNSAELRPRDAMMFEGRVA